MPPETLGYCNRRTQGQEGRGGGGGGAGGGGITLDLHRLLTMELTLDLHRLLTIRGSSCEYMTFRMYDCMTVLVCVSVLVCVCVCVCVHLTKSK